MISDYTISIYLDTRRAKESGLFPVKLRVFSSAIKKAKLYPTDFDITEKEFTSTWEVVKPRTEHKEMRLKLQAIENKAHEAAASIKPFTFDKFEKKLYLETGQEDNVFYHYDTIIKNLNKSGNISNADIYDLSQKSIKDFIIKTKGKEPKKLYFLEITPTWLNNYETHMIKDKGRSRTTVSMYLRSLRSIFNTAIKDNETLKEVYPFGKGKYELPAVTKVKKALSKDDLKKLYECEPKTPEQEKAKDFWFFSYACNGANIKDIALLTNKEVNEDTVKFYRAKTINTSKKDLKEITVYLNDYSKAIINKYGNLNAEKGEYIFDIISSKQTEAAKHKSIKNFTKSINQNLKKLAESNGITGDISTYWARHSFATNAIRSGASMEFVMEALSHNNMKTTKGYFAGFEDSDKKEFMQNLMNF
jgi:integrase/recombinase XerD